MLLAMVGKNYGLLIFAVFIENLGSGMGSVAFLAFIMSLCDHRYTATQFALFSALAATGRVFVGPLAGLMVEHLGWVHYYFWAFLLGFPGIFMIGWVKNHPTLVNQ
jgi:PAT family beta-lactamase induction signal transducer AmpG